MGLGFSLALIAVGAVLKFGVTATTHGVNLANIGVVLIVVGVIGLLLSFTLLASRRRTDVQYHDGGATVIGPNAASENPL